MRPHGRHAAPRPAAYRRYHAADFALVLGCLTLAAATLVAGIVMIVVVV